MKILQLTPTVYTQDVEATVRFYTEVLFFTCPNHMKENGWAVLKNGEAELMVCLPNAHLPFERPVFTGSFYFRVEGVDQYWLKLKDTTKVCYELENFDYGMREFAVYDNNGYLLRFGEEIK